MSRHIKVKRNQITDWYQSNSNSQKDMQWLKREQQRIEKASGGNCRCEIRYHLKFAALFYTNGHFKLIKKRDANIATWIPDNDN